MKRRKFIQLASLTSISVPFFNVTDTVSAPLKNLHQGVEEDQVFSMFENPKNIHRLFVRWWWNGDRVQGKEILRALYNEGRRHRHYAVFLRGEKEIKDFGAFFVRWAS